MIKYDKVSIEFNNAVLLSNFSLDIAENEKTVFYGPSGSGKSSLMSMVMGFLHPASGSVSVNGVEVNENTISEVRKHIAWVPQEAALPFEWVKELVNEPFTYKQNRDKKPELPQILEKFNSLGLTQSHYEKRVKEVSGGEQQRIMLAVAALLNKKILLLDEPTSALDAGSINKVIAFLHNMADTTILAISHDQRFIESFGKQIKIG